MSEEGLAPEKETPAKPRVGDGTPGPGRKKGVPNKTTTMLKEAILEACSQAGDKIAEGGGKVAYLAHLALTEPAAFASLLGKVLPMQVTGENGGAIQIETLKRDADALTSFVAGLAARTGTGEEAGSAIH